MYHYKVLSLPSATVDNKFHVVLNLADGLMYANLDGSAWTRWLGNNPKTVTANYTAVPTDSIILVDASAGPVTVTLSLAVNSGQEILLKKIDASLNLVVVQRQGNDTIEGLVSLNLATQWLGVTLVADGAVKWLKR